MADTRGRGCSHSDSTPNALFQCARLQARSCQVESKYLMLLRRLQEASPGLASSDAELVKSLIQEALQWDAKEEAVEALQLNPVR